MLIQNISIKSLIVCTVIAGVFTLGAPATRASEPVAGEKHSVIYNSVEEIPAEVLEKTPPEMLEEAKTNHGKPIRKTTKTISSTSDVNDPVMLSITIMGQVHHRPSRWGAGKLHSNSNHQ